MHGHIYENNQNADGIQNSNKSQFILVEDTVPL